MQELSVNDVACLIVERCKKAKLTEEQAHHFWPIRFRPCTKVRDMLAQSGGLE